MRTPKEIADEVANALVYWKPRKGISADADFEQSCWGVITPLIKLNAEVCVPSREQGDARAKHCAETLMGGISYAIESAIETALRQCPVPAEMGDDEYSRARDFILGLRGISVSPMQHHYDSLLDIATLLLRHVEHVHRVVNGPEAEALRYAEERGYQRAKSELPAGPFDGDDIKRVLQGMSDAGLAYKNAASGLAIDLTAMAKAMVESLPPGVITTLSPPGDNP